MCFKHCNLLLYLFFISVVNVNIDILFCSLPIWLTCLGVKHLDQCPIQPNIPMYLIVMGVTILLALLLTYTRTMFENPLVFAVATGCMVFLHFHNFCWLIAGWIIYHYHICVIYIPILCNFFDESWLQNMKLYLLISSDSTSTAMYNLTCKITLELD